MGSLPKIFLDFDHTLIFETKLRPHAEEFIKKCREIGDVYILTHRKTKEAQELALDLGLDVPVIGVDDYNMLMPNKNAVLVDDMPLAGWKGTKYTKPKIKALGIDEDHLIIIKAWEGEREDKELMRVLKKIESILNKREWVEKSPQIVPSKQPFKTYDKAKEMAKELEKKFRDGMKSAAGSHRVVTDIKRKSSFHDKKSRGKSAEKIYDVLRGAILVDSKDQVDKVVEALKKTFIIKKVDHKDEPEGKFGYYGATHVDVVVDGMICEIQVMTKKLWQHKLVQGAIYRKHRGKDEVPKKEVEKAKDLFKKGNGH